MTDFDLTRFRGVFPAAMTFFDAEGELDLAATRRHWQWLIDQEVDGLVIAGTSGEFISLSMEERQELFRLAVDVAGGRVPIVAGTGHAATKWTIETSQKAEAAGVDALIVILPYYSRPPISSVAEHYRTLRRHTALPIMLYNNPGNTACAGFSPQQVADLVEEGTVQMIKSTMESVIPIHELSYLVGDRMGIFCGSFLAAYEALAAGAHGWVSGILNVAAPVARAMVRALAVEKDIDKAFALWKRILPIVHLYTHQQLGPAMDIPIYRAILEIWGLHGGFSRLPFSPLAPQQKEELRRRLAAAGWLAPPT
ncbi:MAG: dihydrodipicolinate synthase family protein [Pirellulales bacterium]|nr:dihydrodipicolinate synthase family protein [Pirellulales bacterium]